MLNMEFLQKWSEVNFLTFNFGSICFLPLLVAFSFFLKIGTSHERRKRILDRLNFEYQAMISVKVNISAIYQYMVQSEKYRVLSQYEYSLKELPLRSGRISERPPQTDVCISFFINFYNRTLFHSFFFIKAEENEFPDGNDSNESGNLSMSILSTPANPLASTATTVCDTQVLIHFKKFQYISHHLNFISFSLG